jgi:hypothetical protein
MPSVTKPDHSEIAVNVRFLGALAGLVVFLSPLAAEAVPDPLLASIDAKAAFRDSDFSAQYTIVQRKANQGTSTTVLTMYRRDAESKFLLVLLEPDADRGKGILQQGSLIRKYNPVDKRFDVTNGKEQLRNSNIRLSDFQPASFAKDYKIVARDSAKLGRGERQLETTVLTLEATNDGVTFPKVKLWVTADNLIRAREDYSLSGTLLRTMGITSFTIIGDHAVPSAFVIIDELRGADEKGVYIKERTAVTVASPTFKAIDNLTFSDAYLMGLSR